MTDTVGALVCVLSVLSDNKLVTEGEGGERGIRTLDTVTCITVFETAPFGRSGISPLLQTY